MITAIRVKNFKSFKDFKLEGLNHFTCIIGLNGSGKSTLLQVLEGIGRLAHGEEQPPLFGSDCLTFGSPPGTRLEFSISFDDSIVWDAAFDVELQKFTFERVSRNDEVVFSSEKLELGLTGVKLAANGSLLAHLDVEPGSALGIVKKDMQSLKNLGLLSPVLLREGSGLYDAEIHSGGRGFAGFLAKLSESDKNGLMEDLHRYYPETDFYTVRTQGGGKYLEFTESVNALNVNSFTSHFANDGLLRTLAILSQRYSPQNFILFDEVENGFNQELIEQLVKELLDFKGKQVMITTHSALVVNYIPDETAKQSLIFLFKDLNGHTRTIRFFDIEENRDLLPVLPAGQIMSQCNLVELSEKCAKSGAEK